MTKITLRQMTERFVDLQNPLRAELMNRLGAPKQEESMEGKYLIWSNEHRAWWGPDHRGYVKGVWSAGTYSRDEALAVCRSALGTAGHLGILAEIPVRLADVATFLEGQRVPAGLL